MLRSGFKTLVTLMPLALALSACGKGNSDDSELNAVAAPLNIGDASARHGDPEVLIYYANETAPDKDEQANWDSILSTLKSDEKTAFIADTLATDMTLFPLVVDQETQALKDYFCSEKNKLGVNLVIFTNRMTRAGLYEYCAAGQASQIKSDTYMSKFQRRRAGDFRALSNPLADKETLRWALARTRLLFSPSNHIYTFVMKSHGNDDYIITPRLHVMAKKITPKRLLAALKGTMSGASQERSSAAPAQDGQSLDDVREKSDDLQEKIAASDARLETLLKNELGSNGALVEALLKNELMKNELLKNELMKNELMKNELLKNELMKNELLKNELMKNELLKNELMKNELLKNELMKNELMKNELMKNELMKNELMKNELLKNELMKNELMKNELMKNELLKNELMKNELTKNELDAEGATAADGVEEGSDLGKAALPRIGVSKREFLAELAATGSRNNARNEMHFSVVFTEACRSYLPWDLKMDIAEAGESLKIDYLASSDEGSVKYQNVDYVKFLDSLDESKSFGENLKDELAKVARGSPTK